jgi:hypothetical protein
MVKYRRDMKWESPLKYFIVVKPKIVKFHLKIDYALVKNYVKKIKLTKKERVVFIRQLLPFCAIYTI